MEKQDIFQKTKVLIGDEVFEKIYKANICLCGIGGVGSFSLEAIVRAGVGNITIIDQDVVDITNINRQIIALYSTIGLSKVEVAIKRVKDINSDIKINGIKTKLTLENVNKIITKDYNYVIDAIDDIDVKIAIIKRCKELDIPIISSMGMANRLDPLAIVISDVSKTEMCPLAKIIRKKLKEEKIYNVKVVYSKETPIKTNNKALGSISFVPSTAGLIIASEVIKDLIKKQ